MDRHFLTHPHHKSTVCQAWVKESKKLTCEICGQTYQKEICDRLAPVAARAERHDQEHRYDGATDTAAIRFDGVI